MSAAIRSVGIPLEAPEDPDAQGTKPYLNVCFIGHEDSGKSTTVGHLQFLLGSMDPIELAKLTDEAEKLGRSTFEFAYSMDTTKAEREGGITIDTNLLQLKTQKYDVNVIVCSDNKDFIKNMVTGASQADVAVVVVSCEANVFESVISGETLKDDLVISGVLGCKKVVVCVNKVDTVPEAEQSARYAEVAGKMKSLVSENHPDKDAIIIPISGYNGTGLIEDNEKYAWFQGFTPENDPKVKIFSLEAALNYQTPPKRGYKKALRMPITSKHKIPGVGAVFAGRVESGIIKPGMKIQIQPSSIDCEVKTVEIHGRPQTEVICGKNCGVTLKLSNLQDLNKVKPGSVISGAGDDALEMAYGAVVKVLITNDEALTPGCKLILDLATQHVPAKLAKFISKKSSNTSLIENPDTITKGDEVMAVLVPKKDIAFERMADYASLGKFALRDLGEIIGVGSIEEKLSKDDLQSKYGLTTAWNSLL